MTATTEQLTHALASKRKVVEAIFIAGGLGTIGNEISACLS
ncbi:MAG TPA: hypothetical protein VKB78_02525 [Pirellulales bacterium]|nr:hypothetical protein [Pirellulales bacterium]